MDKSDKGSGEAKKDGPKGKSKGNGGKAKPQVNKADGAAGPKSPETPAAQGGGSDGAVEASEKAGNGGGTSTLRSSTASSTSTTEAVNGELVGQKTNSWGGHIIAAITSCPSTCNSGVDCKGEPRGTGSLVGFWCNSHTQTELLGQRMSGHAHVKPSRKH